MQVQIIEKPLKYGGRTYAIGELVKMTDKHARLFIAIGRAGLPKAPRPDIPASPSVPVTIVETSEALTETETTQPEEVKEEEAPPPGPVTAWRSMLWGILLEGWLLRWNSTRSPSRMRMKLPGTSPPKVQKRYSTPSESFLTTSWTSSLTMTLVACLRVIAAGTLGGAVSVGTGLDYNVVFHLLNAADYGVSQRRRRTIVIGSGLNSGALGSWKPGPNSFS